MIKKIIIKREYKSIPNNFELELDLLSVITGENNSGKTNFVKATQSSTTKFLDENNLEVKPKIIYIPAENIKPSEGATKSSAKNTSLIENLSELFSILEVPFELTEKNTILNGIREVISKTNINLVEFCGHNRHELSVDFNEDNLSSDIIIQALIKKISGKEDGNERNLEDLGQGTQRLIVASILKAYKDILIDKEIELEQPVLILFEEPEIYLHPKIKRTLNTVIEEISQQPNHQVIITTHDAYFAFQPFIGSNKKVISFKKEVDYTEILYNQIYGIEDELLFIFLYSQLINKGIDTNQIIIKGFSPRDYIWSDGKPNKKITPLDNIRHQIHHAGDNPFTDGLVESPGSVGRNWYTQDELASAILSMSQVII